MRRCDVGKSWWHLQASDEEQRSASWEAEGIGVTLSWTSFASRGHTDSRDGKEMQLLLNVGGGGQGF